MSVTSEEINYLIFRYLQESGFVHTGFAFQNESHIHKSEFKNESVQPGALVSVLQKGLQYTDMELHVNDDGSERECGSKVALIGTHRCDDKPKSKKRDDSLNRNNKREKKETKRSSGKKDRDKKSRIEELDEDERAAVADEDNVMETDHADDASVVGTPGDTTGGGPLTVAATLGNSTSTGLTATGAGAALSSNSDSMENVKVISSADILTLKGHQADVYVCSWNPTLPGLLASGSGDATARIWQVPSATTADGSIPEPFILKHLPTLTEHHRDVTSLDWNAAGTLLATGSYDGQARVWTQKGQLRHMMSQHRGPIFALKWNKKGSYILTGSLDHTTIVWDAGAGTSKQQDEYHTGAVLDVDWLDNTTFASSSSDHLIYVCKVGDSQPLKKFVGHTNEVNAIRWDPLCELLASCSDDHSVKIWKMSHDSCVLDLTAHEQAVYNITWAPYEAGSKEPRILASSSFDTTVRLWDANTGDCLRLLSRHVEAVYTVAFNPVGTYLATGSPDHTINIWRVADGKLVQTFRGEGGIFEVNWNSTGDSVAACVANGTLVVAHVKL